MRKVIYGGAVSLDGYLAGPQGEIDWLHWSKDAAEIMQESFANADAYLMGRKTYEAALAMQPEEAATDYGDIRSYVFSRTWQALPRAGADLVREDAVEFVRKLKHGRGKDIVLMGGGELAAPLLNAGLVDEVGLNIHPVALGQGVPVFPATCQRIHYSLLECRKLDGGCVFVRYRLKD